MSGRMPGLILATLRGFRKSPGKGGPKTLLQRGDEGISNHT